MTGAARLLPSIIVLAFVLAACSGGDNDNGGGIAETPSVYAALLGLIPDTPETRRGVTMTDYSRGRELIGVKLPADPNDEAALDAYLAEFAKQSVGAQDVRPFGGLAFIGGYDQYGRLVIRPSSIGYGAAHVDGEALAGEPPRAYQAVIGRFEPGAIKAAIEACDGCPAPSVQQHQGTTFYAWGNDFEQNLRGRLRPPAFDALGRGGRMAFAESYVLRAEWTDGIKAMIDASKGTSSLGKDTAYASMARELDRMGSYVAYLTDDVQSRSRGLPPDLALGGNDPSVAAVRAAWSRQQDEVLLAPYRSLGVGLARDSQGPYTAIVLVHDSESAASKNVEMLRRRIETATSYQAKKKWSEVFTKVDVSAEGTLVRAKLYGSLLWVQFLFSLDPLLLSE
jgi:hypothetical protein